MTESEMLKKLKETQKPRRFEHTLGVADEAVRLAPKFGVDEKKARTAALLHDCAKYINMAQSSECSYNIIMATEIIGLSHSEREMIANIVRCNSGRMVDFEELASGSTLGREEYTTIAKLTAILRVANTLDRSHKQKIKDIRVTLKDNHTMQILVDTTEDLTLEQALLGEKAEFFEEVYSIRPILKAKKLG